MSRTQFVVRGALLVGALGGLYACDNGASVVSPKVADEMFRNYVAIGNSITAGFQSDGINDSTQAQSYAALIARQMGTRFAFPALAKPGCTPPIANFATQARVGNGTSTTCALRTATSATFALNNVAVPGIRSIDPTAVGTGGSQGANPLMELILGGKSMVQKALEVQPTFATIWVGNNDILSFAIGGQPAGATPQATFQTNYDKMITEFTAGAPGVKGVLIGVVQVANAPVLFTAAALTNPAFVAGLSQAATKPIVVDPATCTGVGLQSLIGFPLIAQIRAGTHPPTIYCQKFVVAPLGDVLVLDAAEQVQAKGIVDGYNAYIKSKADAIGFAYYDPNVTLARVTPTDAVLTSHVPNLASATATFGNYISLDGVHPNAAAHIEIAKDLIAVINAKYGTKIPAIP